MSLDKYQQAWKAKALQHEVIFDTEALTKEVQRSQEAFRAMILRRDVREVGTSLVMIPIWFVMGISMSLPWTWYLTVPAMLWIAAFMLVDRRRHPQRPSDPGEPLLLYVKESLTQVEHQIWLLRNVFWWYLLPPSISLMAFFVHTSWNVTGSWWGCLLVSGFFGVFLLVLYGGIYWLNQWAVRKQLEPRRNDLQKLITNLEGEGDTEDTNEMMALVSALSGTDGNAGLNSNCGSGAENWNRLIPSWREVAIIFGPTLAGAYLGYRFPFAGIEPDFPRSVISAVPPFLIAIFALSYRFLRRHQEQPLPAAGTVRLKAPAIVAIVLLTVLSLLAILAVFLLHKEATSRNDQDSHEDRAFVESDGSYAKVAPFTGVRWENDRPVVCVQGTWSPLVSINEIPIDRIMEFANKEFGSIARKRFSEDLVEVLSKMGHDPDWQVTLLLEKEDGSIKTLQMLMTKANRERVRE